MIIDFHTHIFPDKIAEKTIDGLSQKANIKAYTDGTLKGLKESMMDSNITLSIVQPVITKPSQFKTINTYAASINGKEGIISFGGIHPDSEDYKNELEEIKDMGLPGIKLHPDYQNTYINDLKMIRIINYAIELGLIVLIHAGIDIGLPELVHCSPEHTADMLKHINSSDAKIVLAHTGGYGMWNDVHKYLVGKNIWMDISYSLGRIDDRQLLSIINGHGVNRFLFASDSPWGGQKEDYEYLLRLGFSEQQLGRILYKNARELLKLE